MPYPLPPLPPFDCLVLVHRNEHGRTFMFPCPGCNRDHTFTVSVGRNWIYNENLRKPSIEMTLFANEPDGHRCHLYIREGYLHYLPTSTHSLAGTITHMQACDGIEPWHDPE